MTHSPILETYRLNLHWPTVDPFLFCAHHSDRFPSGNAQLGPATALDGRQLGQDFAGQDGWNMYHGTVVPGFPCHPHRGFETVTVVREGCVDHVDSLGAAGRYGAGDVQWMTAGRGIQHAEMFPLLHRDKPNPLRLFQIWLNLPAASKRVEPHFKMLWRDEIPVVRDQGAAITLISGRISGHISDHMANIDGPAPAPNSWAADAAHRVIIAIIDIDPHGQWTLPSADRDVNRMLYFYQGENIELNHTVITEHTGVRLQPDATITLNNNSDHTAHLLLLQGQPINENVEQHGPFVMNTREEIIETFRDFQRDGFGGWPWPRNDYVHPQEQGRFAQYPDGKKTQPSSTE